MVSGLMTGYFFLIQEGVWQMIVHCKTQIIIYDPRFSKISVLVYRCIMSSIFSTQVLWLSAATACRSLRLQMEATDCRYGGWPRVFRIDSRDQQTRGGPAVCGWTKNWELLTVTNLQVTKCYTGPLVDIWNESDNGKWTWELELGMRGECRSGYWRWL